MYLTAIAHFLSDRTKSRYFQITHGLLNGSFALHVLAIAHKRPHFLQPIYFARPISLLPILESRAHNVLDENDRLFIRVALKYRINNSCDCLIIIGYSERYLVGHNNDP